jgi:hypothetical protein
MPTVDAAIRTIPSRRVIILSSKLPAKKRTIRFHPRHALTTSPPLGCNICPVMYDESEDAKKTNEGATSSG